MAVGNVGKLSDSSFYDSNTLYVVGEVKNTGDVAIQNTNVKVIFYNSSDQKITSIEGYTDLNVIFPGRKSFFNIRLLESEGSLNVKSYTIWFNWTDSAAGKPLGLVILSSSDSVDSHGHKHVTGQIQNQGTVNSINTEVSATFYNSSGTVIGTSWVFSNPSTLSPNQIGDFDIELIYTQQVTQVASYSLTAESNALAFSPTSLLIHLPLHLQLQQALQPVLHPRTSTSASPSPHTKSSPNPSATPQNTQQQPPHLQFQILLPNPSTSTETPTTLIAIIAGIVIIILTATFIFYWTKKRKYL